MYSLIGLFCALFHSINHIVKIKIQPLGGRVLLAVDSEAIYNLVFCFHLVAHFEECSRGLVGYYDETLVSSFFMEHFPILIVVLLD